jgi:hypothetical protein
VPDSIKVVAANPTAAANLGDEAVEKIVQEPANACAVCGGTGRVADFECPKCNGAGEVQPSPPAVKLAGPS